MRPDVTIGAMVASLVAGPMLVAPVMIFGILFQPGAGWSEWAGLLPLLLVAMLVGFALAVIPNFIGALTLFWAGRRHPGFRIPAVWAAAGFAIGWLIAVAFSRDLSSANLLIGLDGLLCALICRRFAAWAD